MTTLVTRVMTWLQGERVGTDSFGNIYYQERRKPEGRRRRRWVVYKQEDEASRVPPGWHAWLHHTTDTVPDDSNAKAPAWQKEQRERREFEPHGEAHLPPEDQAHPGPREYVLIAIVLAVVTGLEVALFYVDFLPSTAVVTALLLLMTIKFALVVLWFMHLRFDSTLFRRLFISGLILAILVYLAFLTAMQLFGDDTMSEQPGSAPAVTAA